MSKRVVVITSRIECTCGEIHASWACADCKMTWVRHADSDIDIEASQHLREVHGKKRPKFIEHTVTP